MAMAMAMAMAMDYSGHVDSTYLDMAAQILTAAKRRIYELMGLQVGHRVLDLGCGPASDTIALADLVRETGEVHALKGHGHTHPLPRSARGATPADAPQRRQQVAATPCRRNGHLELRREPVATIASFRREPGAFRGSAQQAGVVLR